MPVYAGGLRATGRKAANALRSNHPHHSTNGQAGGGSSARALHLANTLHHGHAPTGFGHQIVYSLEQIRPRTPPHKLFSATRNFVTNIFTRLSSPGVRVPANIPHTSRNAGSRALHTGLERHSIQSGLSLPVRHALHSRSFGAGTFLPRAPIAPRPNIATNVGLGTARNFSTGRPIFQNIVDNVPIALRSLYEADLDLGFARKKTGIKRPLYTAVNTHHTGSKMKPIRYKVARAVVEEKENKEEVVSAAEYDKYFHAPAVPAVSTYVFVPLAPTPTNRLPLSTRDALPSSQAHTGRFIPMYEIGEIHGAHSRHALRVSTLFSKLDAANVWGHTGVSCAPYSGCPRKTSAESLSEDEELEGVCTFLKLEFAGWTLDEVRGVLGETGQGWCVFEEVWRDEPEEYLSSGYSSPPSLGSPVIDPAQSMVMPTLDFSSSLEEEARSAKRMDYSDPWMDSDSDISGSLLSRSSSFEGLSMIIDPPSENGWFSVPRDGMSTGSSSRMDDGPMDTMF